jgi:uncharacterized membrane protein
MGQAQANGAEHSVDYLRLGSSSSASHLLHHLIFAFKFELRQQPRIATMKFSAVAVLLLLPASILGMPAAEPEQCHVVALSATRCKVINVKPGTQANCRTGPGTDYPVALRVDADSEYLFSCYKKGTCVDGNWCVRTIPSEWPTWLI